MSGLSSNSEESLSALSPKPTGRESRSSEDFSLHTVEVHDAHRTISDTVMYASTTVDPIPPHQPPTSSLSPAPPSGPWISSEAVTRACPCALDSTCQQRCCVQAVQRRKRDKQVNVRTKLLKSQTSPALSYGATTTREENVISPISMNRTDDRVGVAEVQVIPRTPSLEKVHCGCHKPVVDHTTRKAVLKLVIASLIALLFMVGEVLGGYFANSLAIMTDAAHMLSDFAGFLISLFAIWVSRRPPSRGMSFGWHRAEVIGALVSVLLIWVLTGVLFYAAVRRVIHQDFEVDADVMLITACIGVFVNVFMCMVLGHGHGHSHGGKGGHGHSHNSGRSHAEEEEEEGVAVRRRRRTAQNINVRAAFIHVLGDIIQSIGVVIAGYIIWIWPSLKLADPICTFIFCVLVLISTFNILKDALRVVMEGTPKNIDYEEVKADLINRVKGVRQAHSLHIWSLTLDKTALAAHLVLEEDAKGDEVLGRANQMLRERHQITTTTLQVEGYQQVMDECGPCQEPERTGVLQGLLPSCCLRQKKECQPQSE